MKTLVAALVLAGLGLTGCAPFRRKPVARPASPPPVPVPAPPKAVEEIPPPELPPGKLPQGPPVSPPVNPPAPKPVPRPPRPAGPPPAAAPGPAPSFVEILTPEQQARLVAACDQSTRSAQAAIGQIVRYKLSPEQADSVNRIRNFLQQAGAAKGSDPSTAAQLARRAELLANTLLNSLR